MEAIEAWLGRTLASGEVAGPPQGHDAVFDAARRHRVDVLLADLILRTPAGLDRFPRGPLVETIRLAAVRELSVARGLSKLFEAARAGGLDLLLLKGTALAYTHYRQPHLRPRNDVDLLVRPGDRRRAEAVLTSAGFTRAPEAEAEQWTGQRHYTKSAATGALHVDLHWRAVNPRAFDGVLPFDEAWSRSAVVPALGPDVRTLSDPDALLLACVHRIAHHQDRVNLLWLWDIHLIASGLLPDGWSRLAAAAASWQVGDVCARGLTLAHAAFTTPVPDGVLNRLGHTTRGGTSVFLQEGVRLVDVARADLAALPAWRDRMALVREHLWPPVAYMRTKYPRCPAILLPFAYAHRIVRGAPKWFARGP